jgi:uncharacterized protein (DUF2147 family)
MEKKYTCYIEFINPKKLKTRGYIRISLFGKTAYWGKAVG